MCYPRGNLNLKSLNECVLEGFIHHMWGARPYREQYLGQNINNNIFLFSGKKTMVFSNTSLVLKRHNVNRSLRD